MRLHHDAMMLVMRTTVNIDDDVLERAKDIARVRQVSVGEALSALARRGMEAQVELREDPLTGLLVIHAPGAKAFTPEKVQQMLEDDEWERYQKAFKP